MQNERGRITCTQARSAAASLTARFASFSVSQMTCLVRAREEETDRRKWVANISGEISELEETTGEEKQCEVERWRGTTDEVLMNKTIS